MMLILYFIQKLTYINCKNLLKFIYSVNFIILLISCFNSDNKDTFNEVISKRKKNNNNNTGTIDKSALEQAYNKLITAISDGSIKKHKKSIFFSIKFKFLNANFENIRINYSVDNIKSCNLDHKPLGIIPYESNKFKAIATKRGSKLSTFLDPESQDSSISLKFKLKTNKLKNLPKTLKIFIFNKETKLEKVIVIDF